MLRLCHLLNIHKLPVAHLPNHRRQRSTTLIRPEEKNNNNKKKNTVHSLAEALTLTITLNHLANKPQRMASTLFIFNTTDYEYFNKCARDGPLMNIQ